MAELTLEKMTLRDEVALNDLKLVALSFADLDEIKAAQEALYGQIREIEAVQAEIKSSLDRLRVDLALVRSLRADDPGNLSEEFIRDLAAKNRAIKKEQTEFQRIERSYNQAAEQLRRQPKNDQLASKAGALGRQRRAYQVRLEKAYSAQLEKTEHRILAIMVDFTEYSEYLGRMKDRYNRDVGFLIVYDPTAQNPALQKQAGQRQAALKQAESQRQQLLEVRASLIDKLAEAQSELPDDDEVLFFRRQILARLMGQAGSNPASPSVAADSPATISSQRAPGNPDLKSTEKSRSGFTLK